jgi:hypothetical protein
MVFGHGHVDACVRMHIVSTKCYETLPPLSPSVFHGEETIEP